VFFQFIFPFSFFFFGFLSCKLKLEFQKQNVLPVPEIHLKFFNVQLFSEAIYYIILKNVNNVLTGNMLTWFGTLLKR
jgi:hypothetical protein